MATRLFQEGTMAVTVSHRPWGRGFNCPPSDGWHGRPGAGYSWLEQALLKSPKIQPPQSQRCRKAGRRISCPPLGRLREDPATRMRQCVHGWPHEVPRPFPAAPLMYLLATTPKCSPGARPPPAPTTRLMPGEGIPTWGAKAEGIGCAEAAAADPGSEGDFILAQTGLVLAG